MKSFDVGVIGGGLAGVAAAIELARAGKSVALFEKSSRAHDKVCGEFLSPECSEKLNFLGVDLQLLGAPEVTDFRLYLKNKMTERRLPKTAHALSRRVLDERLLQNCEQLGVTIFENSMVTELSQIDGLLRVTTARADSIQIKAAVVATGKFDFKPLGNRKSKDSMWIGYKIHLKLSMKSIARLKRNIDLFVFDSGYGGLVLIEDNKANLAFIVRSDAAKLIGVDWQKIRDHLMRDGNPIGEYIADAEPLFSRALSVAPVPYGFLRDSAAAKNIFCVGDQLAVIPSLAGDGMAIALMSGVEAAKSIIASGYDSADQFHIQMHCNLRSQIRTAFWIHRLFETPKIFSLLRNAIRIWPSAIDRAFTLTRVRA